MPGTASPPTILIADDSPTIRTCIRLILEKNGYRVLSAANGEEAVDTLVRHGCDLVLMDVSMPTMDGLEATAIIRESDTTRVDPQIPILALTAHNTQEDRDRCRAAGMDGHVAKPITPRTLLDALEQRLGAAHLESEYGLTTQELETLYAEMAEDLPARVQSMLEAATAHDAPALAGHAHYIAGSGLAMTMPAAALAAKALESACAAGWSGTLNDEAQKVAALVHSALEAGGLTSLDT